MLMGYTMTTAIFPALKQHEEHQAPKAESAVVSVEDDEGTEANVASSIALALLVIAGARLPYTSMPFKLRSSGRIHSPFLSTKPNADSYIGVTVALSSRTSSTTQNRIGSRTFSGATA